MTALVAIAAAGWYRLKQALTSGSVQRSLWTLVGGGSFAAAQALPEALYRVTGNAILGFCAIILAIIGVLGGFIAVVVTLLGAASNQSDSATGQPTDEHPVVQRQNTRMNGYAIAALVFAISGVGFVLAIGYIVLPIGG